MTRRFRRPAAGPSRDGHDEDATATLELVVLAPLVLLVMSLMFAFGRVSQAESLIDQAARDGARAATAQNSRSQAPIVAKRVAEETLQGAPTSCKDSMRSAHGLSEGAYRVPDLSQPLEVETFTFAVTCRINLSDLAFIPASSIPVTLTRQFVSPIDRYRGYRP